MIQIPYRCEQTPDCYFKQLKHLQEENEGLKQEKYEIEEKFLNLNCKSYSYYKALEEIREIAEICMSKNIDNCYTCKFYNECEIEDAEIPTRDVCKLIKNKINEVLNEK